MDRPERPQARLGMVTGGHSQSHKYIGTPRRTFRSQSPVKSAQILTRFCMRALDLSSPLDLDVCGPQ